MTKKDDNNPTEKLWEKEYIKSVGTDLLNNTIKYLNDELSFPDYEKMRKEHAERFRPFNDTSSKNYESMFIYDDLMVLLVNLRLQYRDRVKNFYESNSDIVYIMQLIQGAETQIRGELEYNLLLDAIPEETKKTMNKEIIKRKNVEETINTLASLNFAIDKEKKDNPISALLVAPTYTYIEAQCIKLIYDVICEEYNLKEKVILKDLLKQDTFLNASKTIKTINNIGKVRIPKYEDTLFYKRINKYIHIQDVMKQEEYKEAEKKARERIKKYIKKEIKQTDKGLLLLDDLMEILADKGWWLIDE